MFTLVICYVKGSWRRSALLETVSLLFMRPVRKTHCSRKVREESVQSLIERCLGSECVEHRCSVCNSKTAIVKHCFITLPRCVILHMTVTLFFYVITHYIFLWPFGIRHSYFLLPSSSLTSFFILFLIIFWHLRDCPLQIGMSVAIWRRHLVDVKAPLKGLRA